MLAFVWLLAGALLHTPSVLVKGKRVLGGWLVVAAITVHHVLITWLAFWIAGIMPVESVEYVRHDPGRNYMVVLMLMLLGLSLLGPLNGFFAGPPFLADDDGGSWWDKPWMPHPVVMGLVFLAGLAGWFCLVVLLPIMVSTY
ncbi:hypothetical protein [Actinoplanes rectilineatus]|uniref:hypothetical protein n=1 Tax=Actinoplanes rectilineatus TaxID=113571 RepID=UPI0005F282D2|nr:hypothetical protein [Actinoplanes rectilineatus]